MRKLMLIAILFIAANAMAQEPWVAPEEANAMKPPFSLDDEKMIAKGEKLFGKICWTCHGEMGAGDGVASEQLDPKPADLSSHALQAQSDGSFYWKITNGRGAMTSYEAMFSDNQRWQLVAFIRSLGKE